MVSRIKVTVPCHIVFFLGILFTILDFRGVKRKHDLLAGMQAFTDLITETLPAVDGIEDEDYQTIIRMLKKEHRKVVSDSQQTYSEMVDYYTIWRT